MTPNAKLLGPMVSRKHGVKNSNRDVRILKMVQGAGNGRLLAIQKRITKFMNWWLETKKMALKFMEINCIKQEIIYHILHEDLGTFIPHSLADEQTNKVITGEDLDESVLPT